MTTISNLYWWKNRKKLNFCSWFRGLSGLRRTAGAAHPLPPIKSNNVVNLDNLTVHHWKFQRSYRTLNGCSVEGKGRICKDERGESRK